MPVASIYNSEDDVTYPNGSDYFSGFSNALIEVTNSPVLVGAWIRVRLELEIMVTDWQVYEIFSAKYAIASPVQSILLYKEIPLTQKPDSRLKLFMELSDPDTSVVKVYVF